MSDEILTMIPGPTPVQPRILEALARPTTSHQFPAFVQTFRDSLERLKRVVMSEAGHPFLVAGSGTLAMEMALVNLIGPAERLLIVSQGYFGDRWKQLAEAFGVEFECLASEWGQAVSPERLRGALDQRDYTAVAWTHVDTSTGTAAPVEAYAEVMRGRDELVILDGVCATAGVEERFDDWGLDLLLTGAQKALGAPPGVAILVASERAIAKRRSLRSVPAYYADLERWMPIMENPALYFSTPPVNEVVALDDALQIILDEGLEQRFARHARIAVAIRQGFATLGLELFTDAGCRADTLSVVRHPDGVDDVAFRTAMARRGVVIAGALGPVAGKAYRVGHMGNIGAEEIRRTVEAIEASLIELNVLSASRGAVDAALSGLS